MPSRKAGKLDFLAPLHLAIRHVRLASIQSSTIRVSHDKLRYSLSAFMPQYIEENGIAHGKYTHTQSARFLHYDTIRRRESKGLVSIFLLRSRDLVLGNGHTLCKEL